MMKLDELLECSETGTKWVKLKDLCKIETGRLNAKDAVENGEYRFFTTAKEVSRTDTYRWDTEALLVAGNANVGDVKYYEGKFNAYQRTYVLTEFADMVLPKYLYYVMKNDLKEYFNEHKKVGTIAYVLLSTLENFVVPIPSLEVQQWIVNALDLFTNLIALLEKEQGLRQKQYAYYRDKLLTETKDDWKEMKVGDVFQRLRGTKITALTMKQIAKQDGDTRIFAGGKTIIDADKQDIPNANIITVPSVIVQSRGIINVQYYNKPFTFKNELWAYTHPNQVTVKYLYYWLQKNLYFFRERASVMGAMPQISLKDTNDFVIYLPSIPEQQRIVSLLEPLETYTFSKTKGIPAELEGRKKQYEYYRNLLFEKIKKRLGEKL